MKTLLIITYVDFWRKGAGHRSRIFSLINYLKGYIKITVAYLGQEMENDKGLLNSSFAEIEFVFLERNRDLAITEYCDKFEFFIKGRFFDFVIIQYIELSLFLPFFPLKTIKLLDTHDLVYEKIKSFKTQNTTYFGIELTKEEEFEIFSYYNFILLIQKNELIKVQKVFGKKKPILVPHAVKLKRRVIRNLVKQIGFIGSEYPPNIKAINWFLSNVWQFVKEKDNNLKLNIYGNVFKGIDHQLIKQDSTIVIHKFIEELNTVYENNDLIINPVQCGAGLKIKNIEALGNSLPLITTMHGASGIEEGINHAFLVADTPNDFIKALLSLIANYELRKKISDNAYQYARKKFNDDICYSPLLRIFQT